jgi:hypothetical protein
MEENNQFWIFDIYFDLDLDFDLDALDQGHQSLRLEIFSRVCVHMPSLKWLWSELATLCEMVFNVNY